MVRKWIQKAIWKPGTLHRQLKIPEDKKIPMALLNRIVKAERGSKVKGITVTRLLKRRANMAITLKRMSKRKR